MDGPKKIVGNFASLLLGIDIDIDLHSPCFVY